MCLIINRKPNVDIPYDKLSTAITNNPDGYGLVIPNMDGTCDVVKSLDVNATLLHKTLNEDLIDEPIMLHLRYTTAGETNRRNLHPFPILEYKTDGVDLWMCHNGTLSDYKPKVNDPNKWESDTRVFVREFVRPLFKMLIKGNDIEDLLTNPLVEFILNEQLTAMSVLCFMDGYGNSLEVNATGNGGKYEEGVWYSNMYSFDPTHRLPYSYSPGKSTTNSLYDPYESYYGDYGMGGSTPRPEKEKVVTLAPPPAKTKKEHAEDTMQPTFCEKFGCQEDDIYEVTDETLEFLATDEPETLILLAKEALARAYTAEKDLVKAKRRLDKIQDGGEQRASA